MRASDDPPTLRFAQLAGQSVAVGEAVVELAGRTPGKLRALNFSKWTFNQLGALNLAEHRHAVQERVLKALEGPPGRKLPDEISVDAQTQRSVALAALQSSQVKVIPLAVKPWSKAVQRRSSAISVEMAEDLYEGINEAEAFDARNLVDARQRVNRAIVCRRGQREFRAAVLRAYSGRCAISNCDVADVLDAAHVVPYRGKHTNHVGNGLLLRTDLHTLFDLGLIAIDPQKKTIVVHSSLRESQYGTFQGMPLSSPRRARDRPSEAALAMHWSTSLLADAER